MERDERCRCSTVGERREKARVRGVCGHVFPLPLTRDRRPSQPRLLPHRGLIVYLLIQCRLARIPNESPLLPSRDILFFLLPVPTTGSDPIQN
jgi:hypothetical protein